MNDVTGISTDKAITLTLESQLQGNAVLDDERQGAINKIAEAIGGLYFAIFHIKMSEDIAICFRNTNKDIAKLIRDKTCYSSGWMTYVNKFVNEEYRPEMLEFGDYATLGKRLQDASMIAHIYKMPAKGWTRVQFIVASRDAEGKAEDVIMAISDANDEMHLEEQRQQAQFEAEHDILTGLYNRKGWERVSHKDEFRNQKIGFMLMDVDHFKELNDNFGHDMGDKVLSAVAHELQKVFRGEDRIFRLGGDEIAVLLYNCDASAWNVICHKLSSIHASLAETFSGEEDLSVTLSVGLCFSDTGYYENLYLLADEALYATKQNGRAGCTLIGADHQVQEQWTDRAIVFHAGHELRNREAGMYRMEIPQNPEEPRRIVCGEIVKAGFGVPVNATPEECYRIWEKGILPEYQATLHEAMLAMISEGHAECTYLWRHPQWGVIFVRSDGFGEVKDGKIVLNGMHYILRDTKLVEKNNNALTNAAIMYALNSDNRYIFEYDPVQHTSTSFSDENLSGHIHNVLHNYPECMRDMDMMHPDDVEGYIAAVHEIDAGADTAHCEFRGRRKDGMRWHSCDFYAYFDHEKGYRVAVLVMQNIDHQLAVKILSKTRNLLYPVMSIISVKSDDFYIYDQRRGTSSNSKRDFWKVLRRELRKYAVNLSKDELVAVVNKEKVLQGLAEHGEYSFAFDISLRGVEHRLQSRFVYFDEDHTRILAYSRNITDNALLEKYRYESEHDSLTGLLNRNAVFEKCRKLLKEHAGEPMVMLHVDVKHFHLYNTFFGEAAGDQLLCKMAEVFRDVLNDYEWVAYGRVESDVFCMLTPLNWDKLKRDAKLCLKELDLYSPNFPLRLAIGAYEVEDEALPVESMFSRATIAAKFKKENMFNLISCFDSKMEGKLLANQQITHDMNTALEEEQFEVYLQPKFALRSEKIVGAEALVRWNHPRHGMISPGLFIPAFEQNGQIFKLDAYMWEHTCKILRRWQDEGRTMYPVSINISRVSMYSHATVPYLKLLVEKYCLDPKYLELELTETAYMDDPLDLKRMLQQLQDYGFKILMDDFGSGFSSLNTLRELPVDVLKLDMKFLSTTAADRRGLAVLSSVVRMSKLLNLPIIAEGVETVEQADYLRSIGCEYVQGYLYGRPMPVADYEKLLDAGQGESKQVCEVVRKASFAAAEVVIDDPLISLGILEYDKEHFAYLRTNKKFLMEFDLVENLRPASKVFREHLDEENYKVLIGAFAECSLTMEDVFFQLEWMGDDGVKQRYHGYVHYHGMIGTYADLSVTFVNVTNMKMY